MNDLEIIQSLKENSQTIQLKTKKPVTTFQALRKRSDSDLKRINDVLHYFGYLSSSVDFTIVRGDIPTVVFRVTKGPLYTIRKVLFLPATYESSPLEQETHFAPPFEGLNVQGARFAGKKARTEELLGAEDEAVSNLKKEGFAFCKVIKKEAIADVAHHEVELIIYIDTGPEVRFGKISTKGATSLKDSRIEKHIDFKEGELYSSAKVERTLQQLEKSGLFNSIRIDEDAEKFQDGTLPIEILLEEAKHKSIGVGVSYTTSKKLGVAGLWDHRNLFGLGNKVSFQAEVWEKFQWAALKMKEPHYKSYDQDRVWQIEFDRQHPLAYFSQAVSGSCGIERRFNPKTDAAYGIKLESLYSRSSEHHTTYYLAKLPLQLKWNNTNSLLDPLHGQTIQTRLIPSYQFIAPTFTYLSHTTTGMLYHSLFKDKTTLAAKLVVGNIFAAAQHTIPKPDRFFSGTENTLRGYRYLTVSPLDHDHKPIGGRSILAASLETRFRFDSGFGWVFFYDVGNVYSATFPVLSYGFLQSVGVGARYSTPIGPLRLDFAVPLNKRRKIDSNFQIYFSIGQSF